MEERFQTRPPDTFFKARDLYDAALYYGDLDLTMAESAVFRYLLENTMYRPRDPKMYGTVAEAALGVESIGTMCAMGEKTARRALAMLESRGMITRSRRTVMAGGKKPDQICVTWLTEGLNDRFRKRSD